MKNQQREGGRERQTECTGLEQIWWLPWKQPSWGDEGAKMEDGGMRPPMPMRDSQAGGARDATWERRNYPLEDVHNAVLHTHTHTHIKVTEGKYRSLTVNPISS